MADKGESTSETRKKHKKKHKKSAKTSNEEQQSTVFESSDTVNASPAMPKHSQNAEEESKGSPPKMAPKPNRRWSNEQKEKLLQNIMKYTSKLSGKEQYSDRVNWSMVEPVDDFTQPEMQKEYQILTKKVRKRRSVSEIVVDAMSVQREVKTLPIRKKKAKPPNAFAIFCKAKRRSLTEKYPELKFVEVHKKLCEKWKSMPEDKREKYVVKAEKAKLEFYEELKRMHDQEISQIKKPKSAYDLWKCKRLQDEELEGDESDFLVEWENLPKSTKQGWIQAAAGDMTRYNLEMERLENYPNGGALQKSDTKWKHQKAAETEVKDEFTSDEQQHQGPSSVNNSGLKRKTDSSKQAAKSPARKVIKKESSSSDDSEESSDED